MRIHSPYLYSFRIIRDDSFLNGWLIAGCVLTLLITYRSVD